ncbi:MAG: SRPBCC family protein [Candidatus Cyclobacteriaceae bacterium M3_2C_046]
MKVLKRILIAIAGIVTIILAAALVMPKKYEVQRSVVINASSSVVVQQLAMFQNFKEWSPWSALDPDMETQITGQDGKVGAIYSWTGNKDVGSGSMKIIQQTADRIDIDLAFLEPWESSAKTYFTWAEKGGVVEVVWGMSGSNPIPMNLFLNMDKMIGPDYEKGLSALKARCESLKMRGDIGN